MNNLLTAPQPVISHLAKGEVPNLLNATTRLFPIVKPRARILYVDDEPQPRALGQLAVLAHIARVQPFQHGGINE